MSEEVPRPGDVFVSIADVDGSVVVELEFWPEVGEPLGIRMTPGSALKVASQLAEALEKLGYLDGLPPVGTRQ